MARFSQAWLDELRSRVTLSGVIARDIKIERAGREYKGCCPFHNENTASFTVNDEKGFYHCFGCAAHGDVIRWMTDHRGLGFVEACSELAGEAGLEVPAASAEAAAAAERIDGLRPTLEEAGRLYRDYLRQAQGHRALASLASRGIDDAAIAEFGLGFAPEHGGLAEKGFTRAGLLHSGLIGRSDGAAGKAPFYYPRFRSRIMVPIHDARGRIVGFGGRAVDGLSKDGAAKYVNSADSEIFDKGQLLFNLHRARELFRLPRAEPSGFRGTGRLVLVEGYMDAIALHRAGFAAVAPMGTALTESQLERAWRVDPCPLLLFDGDDAGQDASVRAAIRALPMLGPGRSLTIATLPSLDNGKGMDPDDIVREAISMGEDPALALMAWLAAHRPMTVQAVLANAAFAPLYDVPDDERTPEQWAAVWDQLSTWGATIVDADTRRITVMRWRRRFDIESGLSADNVVHDVSPEMMTLAVLEGIADATQVEGGDDRLHRVIARLLDLRRMRAETNAEIRACLTVAKLAGFDKKQINARLVEIEKDEATPGKRFDEESIALLYRRALNIEGPMTEAMMPPPFDISTERSSAAQTRKLTKTMLLIGAAEAVEGVRHG